MGMGKTGKSLRQVKTQRRGDVPKEKIAQNFLFFFFFFFFPGDNIETADENDD